MTLISRVVWNTWIKRTLLMSRRSPSSMRTMKTMLIKKFPIKLQKKLTLRQLDRVTNPPWFLTRLPWILGRQCTELCKNQQLEPMLEKYLRVHAV